MFRRRTQAFAVGVKEGVIGEEEELEEEDVLDEEEELEASFPGSTPPWGVCMLEAEGLDSPRMTAAPHVS